MINTQLIDYIKNLKKKGISDDAIKNHLIKYNYSLDLINDCFKEINISENNNEKKKKRLNSIFVSTFVIIILFFFLGLLFLNKNNITLNSLKAFENENCKDVSLSFFKKNENEIVCVFPDNSKVQMILENKGTRKIEMLDVYIDNKKIETLNINLEPNNIFTKVVETKTNNNINELKIIPIIENNIKCKELIKKELNKC